MTVVMREKARKAKRAATTSHAHYGHTHCRLPRLEMRFAQHLSSHLTPEWRKHYIDYETLKKLVYELASCRCNGQEKEEEEEEREDQADEAVQLPRARVKEEEFFREIQRQLENINRFYRMLEARLNVELQKLQEEVEVLQQVQRNPHTRNIRSTRRKRESLKAALCEFYFHLSLLQNFQVLNFTGLRKILKKFDKLACSERGARYHKRDVCTAYFHTSKGVTEMIDVTEKLMIDKIEDGNRSKAMNRLRVPPLGSRSFDCSSLRGGWLMGIILMCLVVAIVMLGFRLSQQSDWSPSVGVLSGLRAPFVLTLWFYSFAINTYGWRRGGVNNVLIFEFDPRNNLDFVQLTEVSSLLGVVSCVGLLLFISAEWLGIPEFVGPLASLFLVLILFLLPLPLIYWHSRLWLFKRLGRVVLAPFFDVEFADFWIADQLNSLTIFLLDIERFFCSLIYEHLQVGDVGSGAPLNRIKCGTPFYGLRSVVAVLPAWWRFAQCLRRYRDSWNHPIHKKYRNQHLVNAGKYSTTFFVVLFSSLANVLKDPSSDQQSVAYYITFVLWIVSGVVSTCYTFTWDVHMDWGLFHEHQCLRRELIYPYKVYYVLAVAEDFLLRILWAPTISVGEGGFQWLDGQILTTVIAALEVFRRFIWNFFRLENEHLNNCGLFRAVRDISIHPLDLSEVTAQDDREDGGFVRKVRRSSLMRRLSERRQSTSYKIPSIMPRCDSEILLSTTGGKLEDVDLSESTAQYDCEDGGFVRKASGRSSLVCHRSERHQGTSYKIPSIRPRCDSEILLSPTGEKLEDVDCHSSTPQLPSLTSAVEKTQQNNIIVHYNTDKEVLQIP